MKTIIFFAILGVAIYVFREKIKAKVLDWFDRWF